MTCLSGRRALTEPDQRESQAAAPPAVSDADAEAAAGWLLEHAHLLPPRLHGALKAWWSGLPAGCESMVDIPSLRALQSRDIAASLQRTQVLVLYTGLPQKLWWALETWQADLRAEAATRPGAHRPGEG